MFERPRAVALTLLLCAASAAGCATHPDNANWRPTWSAVPDSPGPALQPQTVRQVVRTSIGGTQVRIRLSNLYGTAPLTIGAARVAAHAGAGAIDPAGNHALRFGGQPAITIAAGASALSDPADLAVQPLQELAVSLYLPAPVPVATLHGTALQTAWLAPGGDATAAPTLPPGRKDDSRYFLTDVEVLGAAPPRTLVIVGDSITDGVGAGDDRNARWPDALAARLQHDAGLAGIGILNAGIAGNRILNDAAKPFVGPSVLARFERDVLSKPGVRWVLLQEGINDIAAAQFLTAAQDQVSTEQIVAGMQTLVARARARGVRVWAGTLLPYEGTKRFHNEAGERQRQALNAWIRTSGTFDAVVDFDAAMRDPAHPARLLPAYDSGDHLHPNAAGYRVMADYLDTGLLQ